MRILSLSALMLSLVACVTAASLSSQFLGHRVPAISAATFGQGLEKRQVNVPSESSAPSQCSSSCSPVNDEISLGCPVTACCMTAFETQYYNCLECVGTALNTANYSVAQNNLNLLYTTCVDIGYVLSPMALPGQTAGNSTSSAHPASTQGSAQTNGAASALGTHGTGIGDSWRTVGPTIWIGLAVVLGVTGLW